MKKLLTPSGIESKRTDDKIVVSWDKQQGEANVDSYVIQFVTKDTPPSVKPLPEGVVPVKDTTPAENKVSYTITFDTEEQAVEFEAYVVQVQAKPVADSTEYLPSTFGGQVVWVAGPSLTIKIGENSYTLTPASFAGTLYRLPVSEEHPFKVTYDELAAFAKSLGVTLPEEYPDGTKIAGSLNITEFVIETKKKLFALNISIEPENAQFLGFITVEKVGFVLKRTDGTI